ncbi:MAG: hypothetical protein ABI977_11770 [Acidobacteriota bacterium]
MRCLKPSSLCLALFLAGILKLSLIAPALGKSEVLIETGKSTITLINKSGVPALVKLVGPTKHTIEVGNDNSQTVQVAGGEYHILVRYGSEGKYRYSKGDPFTVTETQTQYEEVSITLHTVAGGNYDSRPSSPDEFNKS